MWLTHFWHSWSQFFIFAWDVTAGGILRTGVLICLVRYVPIIVSSWNFQELLPTTEVMSMQKVKVKGQRSRSQRSKLSHFRTLTSVSIHIWQQSDAQSLMWHRRGALFYFSRSSVNYQGHTWQKIADFDQNLGFPDWNPSLNWPMAMKWCTKLEVA